jgi:uncharacterized protein (TIGR03067 family)
MNTLPAVCLALALAAPAPKDSPKKDPPTVVGEWTLVSFTLNGQALPFQTQTTIFTADGKFEHRAGDKDPYQSGTYTADPKKNPAEIDLTDAAVPGVARPCIYKLDGDTLTIGIGRPDVRPTSFDDGPGAATFQTVFKRVKKN